MRETKQEFKDWRPRQVILGTLVVAAVLLGFWMIYRSRTAILAAAAGLILASALQPPVRRLARPMRSTTLPSFAVPLVALAALLALARPLLVGQLSALRAELPQHYERVQTGLLASECAADDPQPQDRAPRRQGQPGDPDLCRAVAVP